MRTVVILLCNTRRVSSMTMGECLLLLKNSPGDLKVSPYRSSAVLLSSSALTAVLSPNNIVGNVLVQPYSVSYAINAVF